MKILTQNDQHSPEARITGALSRVWRGEGDGYVRGEENSFRLSPPLPSPPSLFPHPLPTWRYRGRCDARFPPGKKSIAIRKLAPPNERRYTSLPRPRAPASPSRIPRNSAAGDWRWRPRALRDKPIRHHYHHHTHHHHHHGAQPNPLRIHRRHPRGPETFGCRGREGGGEKERGKLVYQVRTRTVESIYYR